MIREWLEDLRTRMQDPRDAWRDWADAGWNLGNGLREATLGVWHLGGAIGEWVGFLLTDLSCILDEGLAAEKANENNPSVRAGAWEPRE